MSNIVRDTLLCERKDIARKLKDSRDDLAQAQALIAIYEEKLADVDAALDTLGIKPPNVWLEAAQAIQKGAGVPENFS